MHTTRGAALLAAAALTVSGLAACGDEGEPTESSSTASPSAVGSESSSEASDSESSSSSESEDTEGDGKVVELPAAAKKRTKAGAIAFNKFYFTETGRALTTGETTHLKEYSKNCLPCDDFLKIVDDATADGTRMNKNPTSVVKASATNRSDSGYRVELNIQESSYYEVLKDGSKGRKADAISMTIVTDTQWANDGWVIRDQVRTK